MTGAPDPLGLDSIARERAVCPPCRSVAHLIAPSIATPANNALVQGLEPRTRSPTARVRMIHRRQTLLDHRIVAGHRPESAHRWRLDIPRP